MTALDIIQLPDIGITALIFVDGGLNFMRPLDLQQKQRKNLELPNPIDFSIASQLPSLDIATFFDLAIGMCRCVELIHRNHMVHGELQAVVFHWSRPSEESRLNGVELMDFDVGNHMDRKDIKQTRPLPRPLPESSSVNLHASSSRDMIRLWDFGSGLKSFDNTLVKIVNWRLATEAIDWSVSGKWQEWQNTLTHMSPVSIFYLFISCGSVQYIAHYVYSEDYEI